MGAEPPTVPPLFDGFSTERLSVRHWSEDLSDPIRRAALLAWLARILTPAVLAPLPPHLAETSDMDAWVAARAEESEIYAVRDKGAGDAPLGLLFMKPQTPACAFVGYLFDEAAWGRGLASELVGGVTRAVQGIPGLRLRAGVVPSNVASARVLVKNGFQADGGEDGVDHYLWTGEGA